MTDTNETEATVVVYVELLDEGTTCIRPTRGIPSGKGAYRLLATPGYDPRDERWVFPPGTMVQCKHETWEGQDVLVARERVDE